MAVLDHAFNPSTPEAEAEAGGFLSSRTARATQRNPVSKKQKTKTKELTVGWVEVGQVSLQKSLQLRKFYGRDRTSNCKTGWQAACDEGGQP